jgi:hypothetical protein
MRARIANSGMDFWAMLAAAALATLLLVAATQLQAQTLFACAVGGETRGDGILLESLAN